MAQLTMPRGGHVRPSTVDVLLVILIAIVFAFALWGHKAAPDAGSVGASQPGASPTILARDETGRPPPRDPRVARL